MTFQGPPIQTPTTLLTVAVVLKDKIEWEDEPACQTAHYGLVLLDQDGRRIDWSADQGNLIPLLLPAEIAQLQTFMTTIRNRATGAIIPGL